MQVLTPLGTIHYIDKNIGTFQPKDILDMGCGIGNSTLPFSKKYPNSKVVGADVALPCLRYAHARANALDVIPLNGSLV